MQEPHQQLGPEPEPEPAPRGDALGSTAYSERFVLKLLLQLAEEPALRRALTQDAAALEQRLCTLWDMTAERDVALFLLRHDFLALVRFSWAQLVAAPRLAEVTLGLLANLCCFPEALDALRVEPELCAEAVRLIRSDDTPLLIQVLRLLNACLYAAHEAEVPGWLARLMDEEFVPAIAFILTNNSNKDLLLAALENLNTICSKCNIEGSRTMFFDFLVKAEILDGLHDSFEELAVKQKGQCEKHELERLFLVTLEITSNLSGFDKSLELYKKRRDRMSDLFMIILKYYKDKIVEDKEIDPDFVDIVESINAIVAVLQLHQNCSTEKCLLHFYSVWTAIKAFNTSTHNTPSFEDDKVYNSDMEAILIPLIEHLCCFMCNYMQFCPEDSLYKIMDMIDKDFDDVVDGLKDDSLRRSVRNRIAEHKTKLKENKHTRI